MQSRPPRLPTTLPPWRRAEILDAAAARLKERVEEFARIIAEEAAKPIRTARVEAERAVGTFVFAAVEARKLAGEMVPLDAAAPGEGKLGFTLRVPIGVVGAISPFNFPLNLVAHKVAPAIAAGCPVVLKPASQTPFSAITLAQMLLQECGLPLGHLNVVTGGGSTVGNALVDDPDIALITFTGSPEVGWGIKARAPRKKRRPRARQQRPRDHRAGRQLGVGRGQDPRRRVQPCRAVVHLDAAHLRPTCPGRRLHSRDWPNGCARWSSATPLDEATEVSSLISTGERDRVTAWIDEATAGGAKVVVGGEVGADGVLVPTVLSDVKPDMKVCRKEVFGPVVTIQAYDDLDEAIALSNDTEYGLQAAIFTSDLGKAMKAARTLDFGGVLINEVPTWRADQMPYGGVRDSGNTREGPGLRRARDDRDPSDRDLGVKADPQQIYREGRGRVTELVRDLDADALATPVPACPGWTVRDLLCHSSACRPM